MHHGDTEIAGYSITTRHGRVWLVDQQPTSDPGMNPDQARQLAEALRTAATTADKQARRLPEP
jgi:hypothetical protein